MSLPKAWVRRQPLRLLSALHLCSERIRQPVNQFALFWFTWWIRFCCHLMFGGAPLEKNITHNTLVRSFYKSVLSAYYGLGSKHQKWVRREPCSEGFIVWRNHYRNWWGAGTATCVASQPVSLCVTNEHTHVTSRSSSPHTIPVKLSRTCRGLGLGLCKPSKPSYPSIWRDGIQGDHPAGEWQSQALDLKFLLQSTPFHLK